MSQNRLLRTIKKFDNFVDTYRVLILFGVCAASTVTDFRFGLFLFFFILAALIFIGSIKAAYRVSEKLIATKLPEYAQKPFQEAVAGTLFLGTCAIIGMILRGDTWLASLASDNFLEGAGIGFIDPTIAFICIIGIWTFTILRIMR